jgi:hypothetical protein
MLVLMRAFVTVGMSVIVFVTMGLFVVVLLRASVFVFTFFRHFLILVFLCCLLTIAYCRQPVLS